MSTLKNPYVNTRERLGDIDLAIAQYREALTWFRTYLKPGEGQRLDAYTAVCDRLVGASKDEWSQQDVVCMIDIEELVDVWLHRESLKALRDLPARLREVAAGEKFYSEDVDHRGRNFLFELTCACFLLDIGADLLESAGDLTFAVSGVKALAECKRPNGKLRALLKRVAQASSQIADHRKNDEIGVVFVDLTVAANETFEHYIVESDNEAATVMRDFLDNSAERIRLICVARLKSDLDAFIACRLTVAFWIAPEMRWVFHNRWMSFGNPESRWEAWAFYEEFSRRAEVWLRARC